MSDPRTRLFPVFTVWNACLRTM